MKKQLKADIFLLTVTIAWGSTFVLTKNSLQYLPTYNFLSIRFVISTLILGIIFRKRISRMDGATAVGGILIGLFLFAGYAFQTIGLNYTTASKSGFITGLSAVMVPILSAIILKKRPEPAAMAGVVFAVTGLGLLTLDGGFIPNIGDVYTLFCVFAFAMQVILIDKFTKDYDPICLATLQIAVVAVLSTLFTFWLEKPVMPVRMDVWTALLVTSLFATVYAIVMQNIMQKHTSPTHAALIFVGEPVFGALFAYILLGEVLSLKQVFGCILMLTGMVVSELKPAKSRKSASALQQTTNH